MDEQLKAKLMTYLDGLEKSAGKVHDFAAAEIPETVKEWLMWQMVECFIYGGAFFLVAIVLLAFARKFHRYIVETDESALCVFWMLYVPCIPGGFFGGLLWTRDAVKTIVAPRVVIVEKIGDLVKGQK